jgi:hypothetical protein
MSRLTGPPQVLTNSSTRSCCTSRWASSTGVSSFAPLSRLTKTTLRPLIPPWSFTIRK